MSFIKGKEKDFKENKKTNLQIYGVCLILYDLIVYAIIAVILLVIHGGTVN